jgi:hypothetical protein
VQFHSASDKILSISLKMQESCDTRMDDVQNRFCVINWREKCGSSDNQWTLRNKGFKQ